MSGRRRFTRDRQGRFRPRLEPAERELLASLSRQALEVIAADEPATVRLYPVAYPDDPEAQAEFRTMMGQGLRDRHQRALDALASSVSTEVLEEGELHAWMSALEVLRLVLGTRLDVDEDLTEIDALDPRAGEYALYAYLSVLQGEIVDALAAVLPDGGGEDAP